MIPFDSSKVTYHYVYIAKITQFNIEVNMADDGSQYLPAGVDFRVKNEKTVIPIHRKVFKLFEKHNSVFEFSGKGRRACIFYYNGYVLMLDTFRPYVYVNGRPLKERDWESLNIGALDKILTLINQEKELGVERDIHIDGETIFFNDLNRKDNVITLDEDRCFYLQPVRYIRLSKMAVGMTSAMAKFFQEHREDASIEVETDSEVKEVSKEEEEDKGKKSVVVLKEGYVLAYNPYGYGNSDIVVKSPIINKEKVNKIFNKADPLYFNLNFALRAGKTIGKHYGFAETDFLDIPSIIIETGVINLSSTVSLKSKQAYPLNINQKDVLAYLFKFLHKESDLNVYRDLVLLFTLAINSGTVKKSSLVEVFQEGKGMDDLPLRKISVANIGEDNYDPNETLADYNRNQLVFNHKLYAKRKKKAKEKEEAQPVLANEVENVEELVTE